MALSACLPVISEKCSKYGAGRLDRGVFATKLYKKHLFTCGPTSIG